MVTITKQTAMPANDRGKFEYWRDMKLSLLNIIKKETSGSEIWGKLTDKVRSRLLRSLLKEQGYVCCYCGAPISKANAEIEHFFPKNGDDNRNDYRHLIFDYENLFASCCGGAKDEIEHQVAENETLESIAKRYDVATSSIKIKCNKTKIEIAPKKILPNQKLIIPKNNQLPKWRSCNNKKDNKILPFGLLDIQLATFFDYTHNGEIVATDKAPLNTEEAINNILGLNNKYLVEKRSQLIKSIIDTILEINLEKDGIALCQSFAEKNEHGQYRSYYFVCINEFKKIYLKQSKSNHKNFMQNNKIRIENGQLVVPDCPVIPFIEGDGTGVDIWPAAQIVFDAAVEKAYGGTRKIEWREVLAGEKAFNKTGEWLPQETLDVIDEYLFAIKGPLTTPVGGGIRSLNVALRQELDLYACVRPVKYFTGVPSPSKHPEKVNMVIYRENTEDIYSGIEYMTGTPEAAKMIEFLQKEMGVKKIRFPQTSSIGIKPVSLEGSERLIRAAIKHAVDNKLPSVTIVHKGNIMKFTEGAFKDWGYKLAEREFGDQVFTWTEYDRIAAADGQKAADAAQTAAMAAGKVIVKDMIADNFLQQIQLRPSEYSVIATLNLNGDYISDALAAQVGGIGIAPGANINYISGHAIFEATHGTAPKYAGLDKVNPSSVILSGVIMFEYMGWKEAAELINNGMTRAINAKTVTYDFARLMDGATEVSCSGFAREIIKNM